MMKLWFYKGTGDWYSYVIRWVTGSPYSHCLVEFSDGTGASASATSGGVEMFDPEGLKLELRNRDDWVEITLPAGHDNHIADEEAIKNWCREELGCKYDFLGVIMGWINSEYHHADKWFCSEICRDMTRMVIPIDGRWYSPGGLYDRVCEYIATGR